MRSIVCEVCGVPLSNDEVALSIKLHGLASPRLHCLDCAAGRMQTSRETVESLVTFWRESGCEHFQRDYLS